MDICRVKGGERVLVDGFTFFKLARSQRVSGDEEKASSQLQRQVFLHPILFHGTTVYHSKWDCTTSVTLWSHIIGSFWYRVSSASYFIHFFDSSPAPLLSHYSQQKNKASLVTNLKSASENDTRICTDMHPRFANELN